MKKILFALLMVVFLAGGAAAAELSVQTITVAKGVVHRSPVGSGTTFSANVGMLYCFTDIVGGAPGTEITHVWYYNGKKMFSIPLKVDAARWRTWSSKKILPSMTGKWKVSVVSGDKVLSTVEFSIK